jgi:hypothetical protein
MSSASADGPIRFAVTTRSRLRTARFFVPMLVANAGIKRQLAVTPGSIRFASVVAGPREFWTISLWRSRGEMLAFMRSGMHERMMWRISRWFSAFWLMRWRPTEEEFGDWEGARLARAPARVQAMPASAASVVLSGVPDLLAAFGPDGAPTIELAPHVRRARRRVAGCVGVMLRIETRSVFGLPRAWRDVHRLKAELECLGGVLRVVVGLAAPREAYGLAVLIDEAAWDSLRETAAIRRLVEKPRPGVWIMRWEAENEFGQWDGMRVRAVRARLSPPTGPE